MRVAEAIEYLVQEEQNLIDMEQVTRIGSSSWTRSTRLQLHIGGGAGHYWAGLKTMHALFTRDI